MENQTNYIPQDEPIDIRRFVIKVIRYWYWFVISIIIASAIAVLIKRIKVPIYSVSSTLIVNEENNQGITPPIRNPINTIGTEIRIPV